jgi:hypothetical protein
MIEVPQHSRQFVHDIFPDGRGDIEATTANAQVHSALSFQKKRWDKQVRLVRDV